MLISYKTLYSILLGHFTLHFMSHFHQELFPQITICLIVCCCCSVAKLCTTLRCQTLVHQAHLSMRFSRQEYWSGLPFPSPPSPFSKRFSQKEDGTEQKTENIMPNLVSNHLNPSDFPRCLRGKYQDGKVGSEGVVRKLGSPREGRRGGSERVQISVNPRQHCIFTHISGKGGKTPERDGGE